jgi:NADP-dependent 3-hydroxy acid dehydrogenase YdfG
LQDINDLMQTNVIGSVYPVHAALPSLKQRSRTHPICIVFVASLASLVKNQKSDHNTCLVTQTNFKTRHSRERYKCNSAAVLVHMPISHTCL